jgi:hypothetical protein
MLAVLPFENLTGDPNKEYLADGLTEETISQLGRVNPERLGVIARTSVMGYKHKSERLDQIGRDLSVQYVLENSLRGSGLHYVESGQIASLSCWLPAAAPTAWVSRPHSGLLRPECQARFRSRPRSRY